MRRATNDYCGSRKAVFRSLRRSRGARPRGGDRADAVPSRGAAAAGGAEPGQVARLLRAAPAGLKLPGDAERGLWRRPAGLGGHRPQGLRHRQRPDADPHPRTGALRTATSCCRRTCLSSCGLDGSWSTATSLLLPAFSGRGEVEISRFKGLGRDAGGAAPRHDHWTGAPARCFGAAPGADDSAPRQRRGSKR